MEGQRLLEMIKNAQHPTPAEAVNDGLIENIKRIVERLADSEIATVGDMSKPKSLVETFWLRELKSVIAASTHNPPRKP